MRVEELKKENEALRKEIEELKAKKKSEQKPIEQPGNRPFFRQW